MCIAEGVYEISGLKVADLCQHHGEQGVGGDIEWHAEEDVGTALIELAGQTALGDIELEEGMAGSQGHLAQCHIGLRADGFIRQIGHIPGRDNQSA